MTNQAKYPEIEVELLGHDSNAFFMIGKTAKMMQRANLPKEEIALFKEEAMSGDYNHVLTTILKWVEIS